MGGSSRVRSPVADQESVTDGCSASGSSAWAAGSRRKFRNPHESSWKFPRPVAAPCRTRRRDDLHGNLHGEMVRCGPNPRALQRDRFTRLAHDRHAHKVSIPNRAARWIKVDPAPAGNIDLDPGMGIAARDLVVVIVKI